MTRRAMQLIDRVCHGIRYRVLGISDLLMKALAARNTTQKMTCLFLEKLIQCSDYSTIRVLRYSQIGPYECR